MAHPRRLRFGAELGQPLPGLTWEQSVRRLEELGYSTLFVPDHFQEQLGPIAAMASAAVLTDTLTVGSLVLDNDYRHPVPLAMELATIDRLSGGRLEVGIGAGWKRLDYDQSGIPMDPPKVRVDRLIESVQVLRALFRPDPVSFEGEHYRLDGVVGTPPHSPDGPPILIAGGAKRMLRFAGAHADIVGVNPSIHSGAIDADAARDSLAERMDEKFAWVREGAGDRYDELEFNAWLAVAMVTDDATAVAEMIAPGFGIPAEEAATALDSPMTLIGTVDEICDRLLARRDRWGFSYHVVPADAVEALAPVVARLAGT